MNWEPARADHSVDRATISFTVTDPFDPNVFDELVVVARKAVAGHHLLDRIDLTEPIEIQPSASNTVIDLNQLAAKRRVVFRRLDTAQVSVDELSIGMHRIAVGTLRYGRWSDLFGLFSASVAALEQVVPVSSGMKTVRLEYMDRFQSITPHADHFEIIKRQSEYLAPVAGEKTSSLHVHSGWFDFETAQIRKLTNVNVDVADTILPPANMPQRKISIFSMAQFEALEGSLHQPLKRVGDLHDYLKSIFGTIITDKAAARVGLNKH